MSEDQRPPDVPEPTRLDSEDLPGGTDDTTRAAGENLEDPPTAKRLGDFELLCELGRGGMGIVYEARQISLKRRVALKVLPPALGMTSQAQQRFEREAQAAAKLHHTNIVPVHAIGEHDGHHFYAMELIDGQSLDHVLRDMVDEGANPLMETAVTQTATELRPQRAPTTSQDQATTSLSDTSAGGREWFDTVAKLTADVADALHYAHGRGVIHRDVKPANLMLSGDGHLSITDFGLARLLEEPGMTVSGSFLGTPAYMAPEQIAAGRIQVDHRADIYSLGAVLYEMLTMQRPFAGQSREQVLAGVMTKDPRPPRRFNGKIPVDLETICLKALEKDVDRRYATAGEMAQDLRQYLQGGLILARRSGLPRRAWKSIRRHPTIATAIAITLAAVAIVIAVVWVAAQRSTSAEVERLLLEGQLALEAGMYREGMADVEKALTIDPQSDRARILKAKFLMYAGNRQLVLEDAQARLERDPGDWVSHLIVAYAASEWLDEDRSIDVRKHVAALKDAPPSADLFYLRGDVAESPQDKLRWYNRALELEPNHHHALTQRYNVFAWALGDTAQALRTCERIIAARPRSELGYTLKAFTLNNMRDYSGAMRTVEEAIAVDPDEAHAYWTRGHIYRTNGENRESISDFTKAIELRPQVSRHHKHRAQAYLALGEHEQALVDARRAVELNPTYVGNWNVLFSVLLAENDEVEVRSAASELRERIASWPDPSTRAWGFDELSSVHLKLGDSEQALDDADRATELDPDGGAGYATRYRVLRELGDEEAIQENCDRIAGLEIENVDLELTRAGHLASGCSRPEEALEAYNRIIDRYPEYGRAYRMRANFHVSGKRFDDALADYEKAVELWPSYHSAMNGWAWALLVREPAAAEDPARALQLALRANDLTGSPNPAYLDTLAMAYHRTGDPDKAVEVQRRAISLLPEDVDRTEYEKRLAEFESALLDKPE